MSIHEIEAILPSDLFKRVHRSFIIAVKQIKSYTANEVEVQGISLPIGRNYKDVIPNIFS
jgi:DNA-binding LytR/AlgR family response regulator